MHFTNKTIWITGASSGIGEALALAFAAEKANIILSARNKKKLAAVAAACQGKGANATPLPLDLSCVAELPALAEQARKIFGAVDVLVNNAGLSQRGQALDTSVESVRKIMETNFFGTVELTRAVLPDMLRRNSGQIVVVSSVMGKFGAPGRSAYAASKHALHGYFDALRAEIYPADVAVTLICPGYIRTEVSLHALEADGRAHGELDPGQAKGLAPAECARRMLIAIRKRKSEQYIGGIECGGCYLKRFFPGLMERVVRKANID